MRKIFLLPFYFSCVCGISSCTNQAYNQDEIYITGDEVSTIDATTQSGNKCGVDGISCNDSALINYTRTETDYREYGERTKNAHLYTQAAAGNNLTASVRPTIEDDIVVAESTVQKEGSDDLPIKQNDDIFEKTVAANIVPPSPDYGTVPVVSEENMGQKKSITYEVVCEGENCSTPVTVTCEEECEDIANISNDVISSEFTEESFDIADYIEDDSDEIALNDIDVKEEIIADIDIKEVKVSDNTILTWEAEEGDNLRDLLMKWSAMSGWKLLWQTNRNYVLSAGVMFKGKFADVSSALIRAFARARPAPIATYYKGNRVIVVETMENENAY